MTMQDAGILPIWRRFAADRLFLRHGRGYTEKNLLEPAP
jgi:hypothetical protein